ncbi:MAG: winged helix-turn-helix domain-containing protein [Deltaproteobacteria bacterium]|nr:winged helix-turn-helix domain-containing protein [Deltaproteobacteria bacterium]
MDPHATDIPNQNPTQPVATVPRRGHEPAAPGAALDAKTLRCPDRDVDRGLGVVRRHVTTVTTQLSPTELRLLNFLADRPGQVVHRDALWEAVWHQAPANQSRAIDKTIRRLRTKIERDPANPVVIESIYGMGYRLNAGARLEGGEAPAGDRRDRPTGDETLIGRERELGALLDAAAAGSGHLVIVGPAGVGKSRLAAALVRALATERGIRLAAACELGDVRSGREALVRIAERVGVPATGEVGPLVRGLRELGASALLLDDADRLGDALRELLQQATAVAPELRIVVTSRAAPSCRCAHMMRLDPLSDEAAVELFVARMRLASPPALGGWARPEARGEIEALVQRLDRLPLAIELAAARTSFMSPRTLGDHLERRFELLRDPLAREAGRHASLRRALDLSWELLGPLDRQVLLRCAAFEGPFSLSAARAVLASVPDACDGGAVLDALHRLVACSLITSREDLGPEPMLVLLGSVRDYAFERQIESSLSA